MGGWPMLYEIFWLFFSLGIVIIMSIGVLGIFLLQSIRAPRTKLIAVVLCIIIILVGLYFPYQWNIEKKGIRIFTQQVEETIKQYLARHKT
jgi:cytochrome c biogenesis protein CcdA